MNRREHTKAQIDNRNGLLDVAKLFMAALIVFTHSACNFVPPNSLCSIIRWANLHFIWTFPGVEVFAIISSYYTFSKCLDLNTLSIDRDLLLSHILKYIKLYLLWSILYIPDTISDFRTCVGFKEILILILRRVFVTSPAPHLWYLLNLVYALLIVWCIFNKTRVLGFTIISVFCFAVNLLGGSYHRISVILGINAPIEKMWILSPSLDLFRMMTLVATGLLVYVFHEKTSKNIPLRLSVYLICCAIQFFERKYTASLDLGVTYYFFIATPFVAASLFQLLSVLRIKGNTVTRLLGASSATIYFSHWFFKDIYEYFHAGYCGYAFWAEMIVLGIVLTVLKEYLLKPKRKTPDLLSD